MTTLTVNRRAQIASKSRRFAQCWEHVLLCIQSFKIILTFPLLIVIIRSNMATVVCYRRAQALTWKRLEHTNAQLHFTLLPRLS